MAYGDSQYSSAPLQFGNLSPIVEAALQRRKQQQQQQAQMLQAMAKMASQPRQQPSAATPPSNLNMSDAMAGAPPVDITSSDPAQLRITAYGPGISNPTSADYNETIGSHDNVLQPGDVAVSPDLRSRFPIGSRIRIGNDGQAYTVNDFTNPRLHNRVDIWNGQDMGTQPVYGYSDGGVVPGMTQDEINEVRYLDPKLWSDSVNEKIGDYRERMQAAISPPVANQVGQGSSYGYQRSISAARNGGQPEQDSSEHEQWAAGQNPLTPQELDRMYRARQAANEQARARAMNEPQHFASGGVASFTDPYGERKSQYAEHLGPMADVSGIVGVIARQRQFQQEMQQQAIQDSMKAANQIMQKRQNDAIGQALIQQSPEIAKDPRTQAMLAAGAHPLDAFKYVDQQRTDEADAQRQATGDWWAQTAHQAQINRPMGLDAYGSPLPEDPGAQIDATHQYYQGQKDVADYNKARGLDAYGNPEPSKPIGEGTYNILLQRRLKLEALADAERKSNMAHRRANVPFSKSDELSAIDQQLNAASKSTGITNPFTSQSLPNPQTAATPTPAPYAVPVNTPAPANGVPQVGEIRRGYRFLGGNPADQASWQPVQ